MTAGWRRVLVAFLESVALYALLGWVSVALLAAFHPHDLAFPIVTWLPLRRDTFGVLCFAASAVAYLLLDVMGVWPAFRRTSPRGAQEDER